MPSSRMGKRNYLVEGVSGAGKTSVGEQLQRRGARLRPRCAGHSIDAAAPIQHVVDEILRRCERDDLERAGASGE